MRYENFFASCQVHHTDPDFHKRNKKPHYREEFVRYAMEHGIALDRTKRVQVKRVFSASVPVEYYIQHYENQDLYRTYAIMRPTVAQVVFRLGKRIRAKIAPHVSASSR